MKPLRFVTQAADNWFFRLTGTPDSGVISTLKRKSVVHNSTLDGPISDFVTQSETGSCHDPVLLNSRRATGGGRMEKIISRF
jgi:hypothetical protein